jgi:hypothetical protein
MGRGCSEQVESEKTNWNATTWNVLTLMCLSVLDPVRGAVIIP